MRAISTRTSQECIMDLNARLDELESDANPLSQSDEIEVRTTEECIEIVRASLPLLIISTEIPYPDGSKDIKILATLLRDAHILSLKEAEVYGGDDPPHTIVVHADRETVNSVVLAHKDDFFDHGPYPWISYACS